MRAAFVSELNAFVRYVELPGQGPPTVFLHGLGRSSMTLAHIAAHERLRGNRALLVDLLGFGISDKPDHLSYTLEDHAAAVIAVLDQVGSAPYRIAGHSLGGSVAVLVAARRPELVSSLVVAEGNLDPGGAGMSLAIARQSEEDYVREGFDRTLQEMRDEALENPSSIYAVTLGVQHLASPRAMHRTARALVELTRPTIRELLLSLDVPRAFIVGERTLEGERPQSGEAGDGLEGTGVRVLVVPGAGHPMMFQNPDGFASAIAEALEVE